MKTYTVRTLAEAFKVGAGTVRNEIRRGELQATKVKGRWQISQAALQDYLQRHTRGGTAEITLQQQRQMARIRERLLQKW